MQTHLLLWDKRLYQYPNVQEGTCRNHSPVGMSILSLASAIVSAITVVISSPKVLIRAWSSSVQFSSVAQSCPTLCDPMNRSTPGLPVHHQCPEFTQTHVHWVGDAIQPSHPLLSPSPPASNPSKHQGLFQWVNSSHEGPKYWSFSFSISPSMYIQDWFPLGWTGWISLQSKGLSRVFSNTTVQKHQFFSAQLCLWSNSLTFIHDYWKNHSFD